VEKHAKRVITNLVLQCWHAYEPFLHCCELWMADTGAVPPAAGRLSVPGKAECSHPYTIHKQRLVLFRKKYHTRPVPKKELSWQNFYRPDALPVTQPSASKHRRIVFLTRDSMLSSCCQERSETMWWLRGYLALRLQGSPFKGLPWSFKVAFSVPDLETACCQHAVMVS